MPSGYPDWHKGVKTDIIAQTIDKIRTSIDAVTVDKFNVDITAQTLANLNIDIAAQSIERILQAPSYGGARQVISVVFAPPGSWTTLVEVTGKGIIYGGYLGFVYDSSLPDDEYRVTIDATDPNPGVNIDYVFKYNINDRNMLWLTAHWRDATATRAILKVMPGLTFEEIFKIEFKADPDKTADTIVEMLLLYALR